MSALRILGRRLGRTTRRAHAVHPRSLPVLPICSAVRPLAREHERAAETGPELKGQELQHD